MIKVIGCIAVLFIVTSSCKKEVVDNSPSGILKRYDWNEYKFQEITYDVTGTLPILKKDTSYYVFDCSQESKYKFQEDSLLSYVSKCQANNNSYSGKWFLGSDNYLWASIPIIVNGQTYYFGITGFITLINESIFETRKSQIFNYTIIQNSNTIFKKDSTIIYSTYKN